MKAQEKESRLVSTRLLEIHRGALRYKRTKNDTLGWFTRLQQKISIHILR